MLIPGQIVATKIYRGHKIMKMVSRVAYARNGNQHNPTVYHRWYVPKGGSSHTLRAAKQLIDELICDGEFIEES